MHHALTATTTLIIGAGRDQAAAPGRSMSIASAVEQQSASVSEMAAAIAPVASETELVAGRLSTLDDGRGGGLVHHVAGAAVELRELAAQLPT